MKPDFWTVLLSASAAYTVLWVELADGQDDCPQLFPIFHSDDNMCYTRLDRPPYDSREYMTYNSAIEFCKNLSAQGVLPEPRNESLNNFIHKLRCHDQGSRSNCAKIWIGLRNRPVEYEWESGNPVTYTNWSTGFPKEHESCAYMDESSKTWRTQQCFLQSLVICARPAYNAKIPSLSTQPNANPPKCGEDLTLTCTDGGTGVVGPNATYMRFIHSNSSREHPWKEVNQGGGITMKIPALASKDNGEYTCISATTSTGGRASNDSNVVSVTGCADPTTTTTAAQSATTSKVTPMTTPILTMSATGDIPPGSEVTFTCKASTSGDDTNNKYLYKFILQKPEERSPTVLQDFSTNDTYKVDNFQIGDVGIYRCVVKDAVEGAVSRASDQVVPILDQCSPDPCKNDGVCVSRSLGIFYCECKLGFQGRWCQKELDAALQKPNASPADDPYYTNRTLTYLEWFAVTTIPVSTFGVIIFLCCDGMAWFSRWKIKSRDPREYERMVRRRKRKPYLNITRKFLTVVNSYTKGEIVTASVNAVLPSNHLMTASKPSVNLKTSVVQLQNHTTVADSKENESLFDRETTPRRRRSSMIIGSPIQPSTKERLMSELTSASSMCTVMMSTKERLMSELTSIHSPVCSVMMSTKERLLSELTPASSMCTVMMDDEDQGAEDVDTNTSHVGTSIRKKTSTANKHQKTKNTDMINNLSMIHGLKETKKKTVTKNRAVGKNLPKTNNTPRLVSYEQDGKKFEDSSDEDCNRILSVREVCEALLWDIPAESIEEKE